VLLLFNQLISFVNRCVVLSFSRNSMQRTPGNSIKQKRSIERNVIMDQLPFSLDEVVINSELLRRPSRRPDHEAENEAFIVLAQTLADSPDMIL
jgi:hypothetical protein